MDGLRESSLEIEPGHARHADVQHQAARSPGGRGLEEIASGGERLDGVPGGLDEPRQALPDRGVVVDDEHRRRDPHQRKGLPHTGKVNPNVAPPAELFDACSWPPCAWTMVRAMARPMPSPSGLVV